MNYSPIIRRAKKIVLKSTHPHYKLAAFMIRGGNIVKEAVNTNQGHAEMNLISGAKERKGKVVVLRLRKSGSLAMAKPCGNCQEKLFPRKIYYSTDTGQISKMQIGDS